MKICVFSDSHGSYAAMLEAIKKSRPDMVIHLGDGKADIEIIQSQFPDTTLKAVRGNCDFNSNLADKEILNINGAKILLTHGHTYHVKSGLGPLIAAGRALEASLILYGHTHIARCDTFDTVTALNPGSCGTGCARSFAEVNISDSGEFDCRIITKVTKRL